MPRRRGSDGRPTHPELPPLVSEQSPFPPNLSGNNSYTFGDRYGGPSPAPDSLQHTFSTPAATRAAALSHERPDSVHGGRSVSPAPRLFQPTPPSIPPPHSTPPPPESSVSPSVRFSFLSRNKRNSNGNNVIKESGAVTFVEPETPRAHEGGGQHKRESVPESHTHKLSLVEDLEDTHFLKDLVVRYGAFIRLWTSDGAGSGGFLSYCARDARRIQGDERRMTLNVGLNDTFLVLPPFRPNRGWYFKEAYFRVMDPKFHRQEGDPVQYGDEVLLVDEEENVMCHYRGRKFIRRKARGSKGEIVVQFLNSDDLSCRTEICYGDGDLYMKLVLRKGLRTEQELFSMLKQDWNDAVGGFLNCVGKGSPIKFEIAHAPPRILDISIATGLTLSADRVFTAKSIHHNLNWGQAITMLLPSCQCHRPEDHDPQALVRVTLSNGARVKFYPDHLHQGREPGHHVEVWAPARGSGSQGQDFHVLIRMVLIGVFAAIFRVVGDLPGSSLQDPRKLFTGLPSSTRGSAGLGKSLYRILYRMIPPWGLMTCLVAVMLADGTLLLEPLYYQQRRQHLVYTCIQLAMALVFYCVAFWFWPYVESMVFFWKEAPDTTLELPLSLPFDEWTLVALDWRVESELEAAPEPEVPTTFLEAECNDVDKALVRWHKTLQWRKDNDVDVVLHKPHPKFRIIKKFYPQVLHFQDKKGHLCYYEILGKLNISQLTKHGVTVDDLTRQVLVHQEFIWKVLQPNQSDRVLLILDLKGVTLGDVTGEVINFVKSTISLTSTHYPARSFKMLVLNVPNWFYMTFTVIKPLLNETMRQKIVFLNEAAVRDGLLEYIDEAYVPQEYGGKCEVPLGESPQEKQLLDIVETALDNHDMGLDEIQS